ncbi:uncharacterized protein LACBIDRAFT_322665 [Laccaria bicolor S238N-H82]|uniref:Predicted protein n=1 Tax=Laccaria bicolor (strain S238N-H82 / ATCC MYA-4686) TaxID=486041 RepID=B0CX38_LACBS|nr:uncharacterized protein LACBIDRAFT_322665 [Laccaria bicolor S238N-H82]EDR13184.1 predicted protein [Laccaria bicolor S238N-H82]|eukprot:XP_001875682.1 predicted protein [Laccaria bicolor S238N-H82]
MVGSVVPTGPGHIQAGDGNRWGPASSLLGAQNEIHDLGQFQQGQFIIRLVGRHTEPLLKKIWVAEPALMGSTYTSAHQQAPSTMACLYGQGAQCCWGKVTNTCGCLSIVHVTINSDNSGTCKLTGLVPDWQTKASILASAKGPCSKTASHSKPMTNEASNANLFDFGGLDDDDTDVMQPSLAGSTLQCPTYSCRNSVIPVEFQRNPEESAGIPQESNGITLDSSELM